jgi:uncharacterized repeat protein (TIGR01451 family)
VSNGALYRVIEESEAPILSLEKRGPSSAPPGQAITYTLIVRNGGNVTATLLTVTDALPVGAHYLASSDGVRVGGVISWTYDRLGPGGTVTPSFAVTSTGTITNHDYQVSAEGGYSATGSVSVTTIAEKGRLHLPLVLKAE